jgi:hypothetical protein
MHTAILDRNTFVKKIPEFINLFDKDPTMTIRVEYHSLQTAQSKKELKNLEKEYDDALWEYNSWKKRTLITL